MIPPSFMLGTAFLLTALAGAAGIGFLTTDGVPQAPFDVLGILWVLTNLPRIFLFGIFLTLSILSVCCWIGVCLGRR